MNYIRRQIHLGSCIFCDENIETTKQENDSKLYRESLLEHMKKESHMKLPEDKSEWDQSQYLFPTYENDILLSYLPDEGKLVKNVDYSNLFAVISGNVGLMTQAQFKGRGQN